MSSSPNTPAHFRTSVGGQALMEGIMMRGPEKICCAVRKPDGTIDLSYDTVTTHWYNKVPLVRGVCNMAENLYKGYRYLMHAADIALEGVLKMVIFLGYMFLCTRMKELHRVFEYHGAEHKTIACYEAGLPLTVENIRRQSRFHPRCGTSFMILVIIISIFLYAVLPWTSTAMRVVYKLCMFPLLVGVSYEILKWAGRSDSAAARIISQPGLWMQRLTTFEPDDSMIEVAIAAVCSTFWASGTLWILRSRSGRVCCAPGLTARSSARAPSRFCRAGNGRWCMTSVRGQAAWGLALRATAPARW